jgi:hypothetical protein
VSKSNRQRRRATRVNLTPSRPGNTIRIESSRVFADPLSRSDPGLDRRHYIDHNTDHFLDARKQLLAEGHRDWVVMSGDATEEPIKSASIAGHGQEKHDMIVSAFLGRGLRPSVHIGVPPVMARKILATMRLNLAIPEVPDGFFAIVICLSGGACSLIMQDPD